MVRGGDKTPTVKRGLRAAVKQLAFASLSFDSQANKGDDKADVEKRVSIESAMKSIFFATLTPIDNGNGGGGNCVAATDNVVEVAGHKLVRYLLSNYNFNTYSSLLKVLFTKNQISIS